MAQEKRTSESVMPRLPEPGERVNQFEMRLLCQQWIAHGLGLDAIFLKAREHDPDITLERLEGVLRGVRLSIIREMQFTEVEHRADALMFYRHILSDPSATVTEKLRARRDMNALLNIKPIPPNEPRFPDPRDPQRRRTDEKAWWRTPRPRPSNPEPRPPSGPNGPAANTDPPRPAAPEHTPETKSSPRAIPRPTSCTSPHTDSNPAGHIDLVDGPSANTPELDQSPLEGLPRYGKPVFLGGGPGQPVILIYPPITESKTAETDAPGGPPTPASSSQARPATNQTDSEPDSDVSSEPANPRAQDSPIEREQPSPAQAKPQFSGAEPVSQAQKPLTQPDTQTVHVSHDVPSPAGRDPLDSEADQVPRTPTACVIHAIHQVEAPPHQGRCAAIPETHIRPLTTHRTPQNPRQRDPPDQQAAAA
ncbi:MAG: hypothetical protein JJU36_00330 [Phycisphaeraceae bacterium]|nr:hypothetical protein [Phycisphaeraceae bacterium]